MTVATETFSEIPLFDLRLEPEDLEAVAQTLRSGWLTLGPRTAEFEAAFAGRLGSRHAVAVSSCTAALHLASIAAGVGPADEMIVPSYACVSMANAAVYGGGKPVFADIVGQHDLGIDPEDVERRITARTKAVCAVHFAGYPAAVGALAELCHAHGLALIEDCAHAPSATLAGRRLGTFGIAGCFSFSSNTAFSAIQGGLLATDDDEVAAHARRLRSHSMTSGTWDRHSGKTDTYDVTDLGFNYRIDEPRSALLLSRLARLEPEIARRRELVHAYRRRLSRLNGLSLPYRDADVATSSASLMTLMLSEPRRRGEFQRFLLEEHGVHTGRHYPALHELSTFRQRFPGVSLPKTELAARTEVTIPLYPHMSAEEQGLVVHAIENGLSA